MLMLVTVAIELALAAIKLDNEPAKFFRSLGVLKKGRMAELIAQQLQGIRLPTHGTCAYRQSSGQCT